MSTMINNSDFNVWDMPVEDVVDRKDLLWMYVDYIVKNKEFNVSGDEIKDFCYAICTADELFGTNPQALSVNKFYYSNKDYLDALSSHQSSDVETSSGYLELPKVQNARVIADAITLGLQHSGYWKENCWYCCEGSEVVLKNSDLGNSFKVLECPTDLVSDNAEMAKVVSRLNRIKSAVVSDDGIEYGIHETGRLAYVKSASKSLTVANIEAEYKGYRVASIEDDAFRDCTSLTTVTIPDSVTTIGEEAFYDCISLTSITIPDSVKCISWGAFKRCTSLTSVTIPNSVTWIGKGAFSHCTSLTTVTIPDSVTDIGDGAFGYWLDEELGDQKVDNFIIQGYRGTEAETYANKNAIKFIALGDRIKYGSAYSAIEDEILAYVDSAPKSITVANIESEYEWHPVTHIGYKAFKDCTSLTTVTIPNSVRSIGELAFKECTSLTSVTIPDSVTSIDKYAFSGCTSLTEVTIGDSVTSIDHYAFQDCTSLTSVTIPSSVTDIGKEAFGYIYDFEVRRDKRVPDFTIYGYTGTEAETYANKNEFKFVALDGKVSDTNVKEFSRIAQCEKLLFKFTEDAVRSISLSKLNYTQSDLQDALFRYIPKLEVPVSIVENLTEEARNFVSKYFVCKDDITDSSFTQEKISDYVTFCHIGFMQVFAEMVERSYRQHGGAVAGAVGMLLSQSVFPCGYYFKRGSSILLRKADTSNAVSGLIGALFNSDPEKSSNKYFIETLLFAYANILCSNKPSLAEVKEMFK